MARLNAEEWEFQRALRAQEFMREATLEGVEGNDSIPRVDVPDSSYPTGNDAAINQGIRRMAHALFRSLLEQEQWQPLVLAAGWGWYGAPWHEPGYMRDALGFVHLRGLITRNSGVITTFATLPGPYWPAAAKRFGAFTGGGIGSFDVTAAGDVIAISGTIGPPPSGYLSLENIAFDTRG